MEEPSVVETIEIYENERAWLGRGFAKGGLLPNDRGRYSTLDGSASWKTISEAEQAMLLPGYSFVENTSFVPSPDSVTTADENPLVGESDDTNKDAGDGWYYARDFSASALEHKSTTRGVLHWVRFRKLVRATRCNPHTLFTADERLTLDDKLQKCDFADSQAVQRLSNVLVEVVAYLTQVYNPRQLTQAALLTAKRQVLQQVLGNPDLPHRTTNGWTSQDRLNALHKELEQLADTERNKPQHLLNKVDFYRARQDDVSWKRRCRQIADAQYSERSTIAGWMVRLLDDQDFTLHCDQIRCGNNASSSLCPFFHISCPNEGCPVVLSQKHLAEHEKVCNYKRIACQCGESIPRQHIQHHRQEVCPLRDSSCPFYELGCTKVCQAQDIPQHVETDVASHLLLALDRMMEFQTVIRTLHGKIASLQDENQQLHQTLQVYRDASVSESKATQKRLTELHKKVTNLETSNRKEFKRIRDHSRERAKANSSNNNSKK